MKRDICRTKLSAHSQQKHWQIEERCCRYILTVDDKCSYHEFIVRDLVTAYIPSWVRVAQKKQIKHHLAASGCQVACRLLSRC